MVDATIETETRRDVAECMAPMPRYQSHKRVWALKIASVEGRLVSFVDDGFAPVEYPAEMFARGTPKPGDYLVQYEGDGYMSFSPGKAFEDGYRPATGLTFGDAINLLKAGKRVARAGWNGKGMWLALISDWNGAGMAPLPPDWSAAPFIVMKPVGNAMAPWLASQADMLAEDWREVLTPLSYSPKNEFSLSNTPEPTETIPSPECSLWDPREGGNIPYLNSQEKISERIYRIHQEFERCKRLGLPFPAWPETDRPDDRS